MLSPCLFNLYAEYIMRNTGLEETQAGIKIAGRNSNHLRYADDTTLTLFFSLISFYFYLYILSIFLLNNCLEILFYKEMLIV